jgi:hypothetical protein
MTRFLVALNLLLLAVGGSTALLAWWSGLWIDNKWRTEAIASEGDLNRCVRQLNVYERRMR